jgi:hypothetical protein
LYFIFSPILLPIDGFNFQDWYAHRLANPWTLPSINKFRSKIAPADWDVTPSVDSLATYNSGSQLYNGWS